MQQHSGDTEASPSSLAAKEKNHPPLPIEVTNGSNAAAMIYRMGLNSNRLCLDRDVIGQILSAQGSTASPILQTVSPCAAQCQRRYLHKFSKAAAQQISKIILLHRYQPP
jgi:hypothetical protein